MTQTEITAYFEEIAIRFKPISHNTNGKKRFAVIDSDEITEATKRNLDFSDWCMLLEESSPRITANDAKAFHEYYTFRYTICKDISRYANQRSEIKQESLEYSKQIFAHIIEHYKSSKLFAGSPFALKNVKFEATFEAFENILNENLLGYDCQLTISSHFDTKTQDPTLWN